MSRRRPVLLSGIGLGICALWWPACDKKRPAGPAAFELRSRGKAPRHELAYKFRRGDRFSYRFRFRLGLARVPHRSGATTTTHFELRVGAVKKDRAQVLWRFTGIEGAPPSHVRKMAGMKILTIMNRRGRFVRTRVTGIDPGLTVFSRRIAQGMRQSFAMLPEGKVGVGARWIHRSQPSFSLPGGVPLRARLQARYELEGFPPCGKSVCARISADLDYAFKAKKRQVSIVGEGTGKGTLLFDVGLGRLARARVRSEFVLAAKVARGQAGRRFLMIQEIEQSR